MMASALRLAVAGLIAIFAAAPCTAGPAERPDLERPPGDGGGDPPDDPCVLTGIGCVSGIVGSVPACEACITVIGCIACGGTVSATIAACLNYMDRCANTAAHEGDLCHLSNRCETAGLHCVDSHCQTERGAELQRCSSPRDCRDGMDCLPDGEDPDRTAGHCWRMRSAGELCGSSAECVAGLLCDPSNHTCRRPGCSEGTGNAPGCTCTVDAAHPAPQGDCPSGYKCDGGRCAQVTVTICNCDGTDAPGTCLSCQPPPVGGGPPPPTFYYYPTCYYFYDSTTYYTCASYGDYTSCGDPQTEYFLVDSFCI